MADASGVLSALAFDQEAHQNESALDIFLQFFPRSAAEFPTAAGLPPDIPFPPALEPRARDAISCATMGGTWNATRRQCIPPVASLPAPTFPGPGGPMTPAEDAAAAECASRGGFYDRSIGQCRQETGTPTPGGGPSGCEQRCTGDNVIVRGACRAACAFGSTIAPILIVLIGIILVLVALALIVK